MSEEGALQVGVTASEANQIINEHSHYCNYLIARVEVDINRLYEKKISEKKLMPRLLNTSTTPYLLLLKNTTFSEAAIHSIDSRVDYMRSTKYSWSINFDEYLGGGNYNESCSSSCH